MSHWPVLPILVPLLAAVLLSMRVRGVVWIASLSVLVQLLLALVLMNTAVREGYQVYALGNWPPPFGIVLVVDRLSALMLLLTALVALAGQVYSWRSNDRHGRHFHTLFQFQMMGLNGAFLTGDLFNLFVFFEVLLIASYGLALYGTGRARVRAGMHYVVLNLAGSTVFLVALAIIYGVTGTLNMAHLARVVPAIAPADVAILESGALLLLVVFALKAALVPLYFWLPATYSAVTAPTAALFAIMTKVGAYSILRIFTLVFGAGAGPLAGVAEPWLLPVALVTIALGAIGAFASHELRRLASYLVVVSVGTLFVGIGLFTREGIAAALYYMAHSTLVMAALFLLADIIAVQRGDSADRLYPGPALPRPWLTGSLYFAAAIAVAGLPPLSGFVGKVLILLAGGQGTAWPWIWAVILPASLLAIIALSRAGSMLFWRTEAPVTAPPSPLVATAPVVVLLGLGAMLVLAAGPVQRYVDATARQLVNPTAYIDGVLGMTHD